MELNNKMIDKFGDHILNIINESFPRDYKFNSKKTWALLLHIHTVLPCEHDDSLEQICNYFRHFIDIPYEYFENISEYVVDVCNAVQSVEDAVNGYIKKKNKYAYVFFELFKAPIVNLHVKMRNIREIIHDIELLGYDENKDHKRILHEKIESTNEIAEILIYEIHNRLLHIDINDDRLGEEVCIPIMPLIYIGSVIKARSPNYWVYSFVNEFFNIDGKREEFFADDLLLRDGMVEVFYDFIMEKIKNIFHGVADNGKIRYLVGKYRICIEIDINLAALTFAGIDRKKIENKVHNTPK